MRVTLASIPSPTTAVWDLGPIPVRAYALCIILGIVVACVVTEARLRARGAPRWTVLDLAAWAVPTGIVGARLYHVVTAPHRFFGDEGALVDIVKIWEGGLGIWGGVAGGAVGVWIACRQLKLPFLMVADATAVGLPLAQAIGRLGNWFNNELYGAPTSLPWGLEVYQMVDGQAVPDPVTGEVVPLDGLYHPTFLYEALWNVAVAVLVWQLGKQLRLGRGRQFALYVMGYTAGRTWIEMLRIDDTAQMPVPGATDTVLMFLGQRVNVWVSLVVFLAALAYFLLVRGAPEYVTPAGDGGAPDARPPDDEAPGQEASAEDPSEDVPAEDAAAPLSSTADSSEPADSLRSGQTGPSSHAGSGDT